MRLGDAALGLLAKPAHSAAPLRRGRRRGSLAAACILAAATRATREQEKEGRAVLACPFVFLKCCPFGPLFCWSLVPCFYPGGHVICRPPIRCRCRCSTVC